MNRKFLGVLFVASVCLFPVASFAQAIGGGQGGTPGPAANASSLSGCVFISAGITLADPRTQGGLQCDSSGNLKVTISGGSGSNQNVNLAQVAGTATATAGVNGLLAVGGSSASGATDDGSDPVKMGGVFMTSPTVITNGQRGSVQVSPQGALGIAALNGASYVSLATTPNAPTTGAGTLSVGLTNVFNATPSVLTDGQYGTTNITARHALQVAHVATDGVITAASGNVANASAVATLAAGGASKTTYITGFQCTSSGATVGAAVNATVAGVVTGTMTYTFVFPVGVAVAATPLNVSFPNPIPASALNTAITVTLPAGGTGNTNAACNAQGYQL